MPISDDARRGRERHGVDRHNFDTALKLWEGSPPKEKGKYAIAVLANAGAINAKMSDLIDDPEKINAIRRDARGGE